MLCDGRFASTFRLTRRLTIDVPGTGYDRGEETTRNPVDSCSGPSRRLRENEHSRQRQDGASIQLCRERGVTFYHHHVEVTNCTGTCGTLHT